MDSRVLPSAIGIWTLACSSSGTGRLVGRVIRSTCANAHDDDNKNSELISCFINGRLSYLFSGTHGYCIQSFTSLE